MIAKFKINISFLEVRSFSSLEFRYQNMTTQKKAQRERCVRIRPFAAPCDAESDPPTKLLLGFGLRPQPKKEFWMIGSLVVIFQPLVHVLCTLN